MSTIIYTSNAGSTKRYAEMLSKKTGLPFYELSKAPDNAEDVIYLGWVMTGTIQGLDKAREKFGTLKAICSVGMVNTEKEKNELIEKNKITEPYFLLHGAFDLKSLKGMYKMLMSMMLKMVKAEAKKSEDEKDAKALQFIEEGFDAVSEEQLQDVLSFINAE